MGIEARSPGPCHETYLARRHFESLDGVRCLCILSVMWHHAEIGYALRASTRGFLGVDMFFVLSGFLIVTLLLRERSATGAVSLRRFYMRRVLRIFPAYYGLLLVLTVGYLLFRPGEGSSLFFATLPWYVVYLSNWSLLQAPNLGIMWSLATEEQFYLVWPACEKVVRGPWLPVLLGAVLVVNQLINFGWLDGWFASLYGLPEVPELAILDTTFTPICLGVILAHLLHGRSGFERLAAWLGHRHVPALLLLALVVEVQLSPADISGWPRLLIHTTMALWLGSLVVGDDHSLRPLLAFRPIARIGAISYGMYLFHLWAFHLARGINGWLALDFELALFLTGSLVTVVVAELSFRFLEAPFLGWKKRFAGAS